MSTHVVEARRGGALVAAARRRLGRLSLAGRFALASAVILLSGAMILGGWLTQEVETSVIRRVAADSALYVEALVADEVQALGARPLSEEQRGRLRRAFDQPIREGRLLSVKIWNGRGEIVYATDETLVGTSPSSSGFRAALGGSVVSRRTGLGEEEQAYERRLARSLIETYIPLRVASTDRIVAVAEFYQRPDLLEAELDRVRRSTWLIIAIATIAMYVLLAGMVRAGSDTIEWQRARLEETTARLREVSAARAQTDEEQRRRVARELHDGLTQDLATALLTLDRDDTRRSALARAAVESALAEVRSLTRGLALPDLARLELAAVVERACSDHERKVGRHVTRRVATLPAGASAALKIAAYRILQEALANAFRHAQNAPVTVNAVAQDGALVLECADEGPGLDPSSDEGLGIRGMRERAELLGGRLEIQPADRGGTVVSATLPLSA